MSFLINHRLGMATRYFAFNGAVAFCAVFLLHTVAERAMALAPSFLNPVEEAEPSRVEKFKDAEAASAQAPQVPVPHRVIARSLPEYPVQVLAVRLDDAESLKIQPLRLQKTMRPGSAQPMVRNRKVASQNGGKLPAGVIEFGYRAVGATTGRKQRKRLVLAESSRDITNRNLGVLVALKN